METIFEQIESSQRQHHSEIQHSARLECIETEQQYLLFSLLKPKIYQDGNQWCVLLGENIIEGICGFGETPHKAILDWNCAFNKTIDK